MNELLLVAIAATSNSPDLKIWAYTGFTALVIFFMAVDLGILRREARGVAVKKALTWSVVWLTCGIAFGGFVYLAYESHWLGLGLDTPKYSTAEAIKSGAPLIVSGNVQGLEAAKQYIVGFAVEKSVAMENVFIIAVIFSFFAVPPKYQHRVLFWGIIGAPLLRSGMTVLGAGLILQYQSVLIIFGVFLILTALRMALIKGSDDVSQNIAVKLGKKFFRVTGFYDEQKFFTKRTIKPTFTIDAAGTEVMDPAPTESQTAAWAITPLLLTFILVQITGLVFAVESVPAIFAITPDPFIMFTSNIFAVLGLRALYYCLTALFEKFRFLKPALILILAFDGIKLLLLSVPPNLPLLGMAKADPIKIDTTVSLLVVAGTLALATVLSVAIPARAHAKGNAHTTP